MNKANELKEKAKFETIPSRFKDKPPSKEQTYYFIESELQEYASEIAKEQRIIDAIEVSSTHGTLCTPLVTDKTK